MRFMTILVSISAALVLAACTADATGASSPGLSPTPENHCLLDGSSPGALPHVIGAFAFDDGTPTNAPPALSGGDPTGDWVVQGFTLYLPGSTEALVNVDASSVEGESWLSIGEDGQFQMNMTIDVSVLIGAADAATPFMEGTLDAGGMGSYRLDGTGIVIAEDCFYAEGLDLGADTGGEATIDPNIAFRAHRRQRPVPRSPQQHPGHPRPPRRRQRALTPEAARRPAAAQGISSSAPMSHALPPGRASPSKSIGQTLGLPSSSAQLSDSSRW